MNAVKDTFSGASSKKVRLPPILPTSENVQKRISKIPVVSGKRMLAPLSNIYNLCVPETGLSAAAAKRQKYHLSRYPATTAPKQDCQITEPFHTSSAAKSLPYHKFLPALSSATKINSFHTEVTTAFEKPLKVKTTCYKPRSDAVCQFINNEPNDEISSVINGESQPKCTTGLSKGADSHFGKKKKGLLGEFTHFPTVCNVVPIKPIQHCITGLSPVLPKIIPKYIPAAPPPSVSSSLEQEEATKERKMQSLKEDHKTKKNAVASLQLHSKLSDSGNKDHPFHGVSIVVEPADIEVNEFEYENESENTSPSNDIVRTLMELAQLRKEAFLRLLEEHAEIVQKIKQAETGQI